MRFPKKLDGAHVLYYTPKGNYGVISYYTPKDNDGVTPFLRTDWITDDTRLPPNEEADCIIAYLAIAAYKMDGSDGYYLFKCSEDFEVQNDWLLDSIDACMKRSHVPYDRWIRMEA